MPKVCLDPGHGGADPGAIGPGGLKEKDVNLAVAKQLASHLSRHGLQVVMIRDGDQTVSLDQRCQISGNAGADLFVSIHCNAAEDRTAHGSETWRAYVSSAGKLLAEKVQAELVTGLGRADRGIKQGNKYVLKNTKAPAVLTELAFISNPEEEQLLASTSFQEQSAEAIAKGICAYLNIAWVPENGDTSVSTFPDVVNHWAKNEIQAMAKKGLLAGYPDGNFHPDDPVTRAQLAVVL